MATAFKSSWRFAVLVSLAVSITWLAADLASLAQRGAFYRFDGGMGLPFGRDFFNFWTYGVEAWHADAGRFYDYSLYWRHVADVLGAPYWNPLWSYPPTMMLVASPFGLLPYHVAFLLWQIACFAVFVVAVRPFLQNGWDWLLIFAAPAALMQWQSGQQAYFFAALLIIGFREAGARPWLSGLAFGLLTMKPQLGLLVPFLLLVQGQRQAFWWSAAFALAFNGLSIVAFGADAWRLYLGPGLAAQMSVLLNNDPVAHQFMPSLYISLQLAGVGATVALGAQAVLAAMLLMLFFSMARSGSDEPARLAFAITCTLAATPYLMSYDLLGTLPLILLAARRHVHSWQDLALLCLFAAAPLMTYWLGAHGWPGGVIFLLAGIIWFWRKETRQRHAEPGQAGVLSISHG